ncbi:MAG: hypothetical protein LBU45_06645 [Azoarcus sp.]|jgi:hypothetical protein|nr:hypothetical protein [Azoarcus sp.]
MPRLLFVHQNFPSQYYHIARRYTANPDNTVIAIGDAANLRLRPVVPGVILVGWELPPPAQKAKQHTHHTHHYVRRFEADVRRGQAAVRVMARLRDQGFTPDLILVHPDWGEGLFLRLIWRKSRFWPTPKTMTPRLTRFWISTRSSSPRRSIAAQATNATRAITLAEADRLQTPTRFQFNRLPASFQAGTSLLYDGISAAFFSPNSGTSETSGTVLELPRPKRPFPPKTRPCRPGSGTVRHGSLAPEVVARD